MINSTTLIQALTIVLILFFALYLQYSQSPYSNKQLNIMELEAVTTASVTIYCGLYYLSNALNEFFQLFLFVVILFGNFYFVFYWLYYMSKAVFDMIIKVFPFLKKRFKRGDGLKVEIYQESIAMPGSFIDPSDGVRKPTFLTSENCEPKAKLNNAKSMEDVFKLVMLSQLNHNLPTEEEGYLSGIRPNSPS